MAKKLVVMIPTAGRSELLHMTLASLVKCRKPEIYHGTILVENGPKTGAEKVARAFEKELNLRHLYVPAGNKSNALNEAMKNVNDCLIFFTDDDVKLDPGILNAYAEAAEGRHGGEFYGGPFEAEYARKPDQWILEFLPLSAVGWNLGKEPAYIDKSSLFIGFNWAAFDRDIKRCGGFNVLYGPGSNTGAVGQETEMQKRLLENGLRGRYVPEAKVWHFVPPEKCSTAFTAKRAYKWGIQGGLDYDGSLTELCKNGLVHGVTALLALANKEPHRRFKPFYKLCFSTGMIKGNFISRRKLIGKF
jgi:GT2 family glycosyltransferase